MINFLVWKRSIHEMHCIFVQPIYWWENLQRKNISFFISFLISSQFNQIRQLYRLRANLKKKKIKIKSFAKLLFHREKQIKKDNTTRIRWKKVSKKKRNKIEFLSLFLVLKTLDFVHIVLTHRIFSGSLSI